jgi:vitamin B12 transporter
MSQSFCGRVRRSVAVFPAFLGLIVLATVPTAATASTASTQSSDPDVTVIVTATRTPQRADQAVAQVTVIDRARIAAASGRTLAELLAGESGVQFWSNGGLGKSASVSLRGLESRHTLLLIDGVRYGSATLGTPSWDNIPLDAIERIEIVRGPMSGLYGSDAVGGVVQIFTHRGQQGFHPEVAATVGSQSYGELAAGVRFGSGAFDGSLRLQHRRTDGFSATNPRVPFGNFNPDDDGFDQTSVNGRLGLTLGEWRAEAMLLESEGTNHYDDGPGADTRAELRTEVLSGQLSGPVTDSWRTAITAARSRDDFETLASASAFTTLGTIGTTLTQFSWENQIATPLGTALALAERVEQEVERPGAPFAVSERSVTGVALGLNGEAGDHAWQANVRRDRNSQFGRQTTGALGYGYTLVPGLRATASFGRSFVAPSFNQLYFPNFGNPDLLPEEGRQRELGLVWRHGPVTSRIAYFENRIRGYITSGPLPTNIPRTKVDGVSASVDAVLGAWTIAASIDHLDPVNASRGSPNFGRILPRRVQDGGRLAVDWRQGAFAVGGTLQAVGKRFDNASNSLRVGGYSTLDLRAEWSLARDWILAARLNNSLDKRYETVYGYNQPGREAYLSLRWTPR